MFERVVSLKVEKAYEELKNLLFRSNCRIVAEEHSKSINVEQGSLWGVSPKGVKKIISFHLSPHNSGTRIVSVSSLDTVWTSVSLLSYVLGGIVAFIFWWIATDLEAGIIAWRRSFWGWLAEAFGYTSFREASMLVSLLKILSFLMVIVIIMGIIIDVYIYARKDSFAEETLRLLP